MKCVACMHVSWYSDDNLIVVTVSLDEFHDVEIMLLTNSYIYVYKYKVYNSFEDSFDKMILLHNP